MQIIRCNSCGKEVTDNFDNSFDDFEHLEIRGGYNSSIGDGTILVADLCHTCIEKLLGSVLVEKKNPYFLDLSKK
jgi:hypothetical protein